MRYSMTKPKEIVIQNTIIATPARYRIEIAGTGSPLIMNKMPDQFKPLEEKNHAKPKKMTQEDRLLDELAHWKEKAYVLDPDGLYIPGDNIQKCLIEGATYSPLKVAGDGKKKFGDLIKSACIVYDCILNRKVSDLIQFRKSVTRSSGMKKSKVAVIRPMLNPGWVGSFDIQVFDNRLTEDYLPTIISYAGLYRGLCDWRPKFGRFEIKKMERIQ
jgi:hypothetical protein